jgi:hypothetical protein
MTRRDFTETARDLEYQSRALDVSDGFSDRSSTLPAYEDAIADGPDSTSKDLKSDDGKQEVSETL